MVMKFWEVDGLRHEPDEIMTSEKKTSADAGRYRRAFSIVTLGCKVNQYESESIAHEMIAAGHRRLNARQALTAEKPGLCIVNTCTVTRKAAMQSRQAIRQAIRAYPKATIVVTGCLAQTEPDEIEKIQGVHAIVGHADKFRIPQLTKSLKNAQTATLKHIRHSVKDVFLFQDMRLPALGSRTRPFLKIQDGCNAYCSYCIVPHARGPSRSMPLETVLQHVDAIHDAGYHEVVLTGIHLGRYGLDLQPKTDLFHLLRRISEKTSVHRIRLSSIEPLELTPKLIELAAQTADGPGRVCPHFHIPLQSGDDAVLKRMRRPYGRDDFRHLITRVITKIPGAAVGADVLIGFPGETETAFSNTFQLLAELPLAYLHVFPFSPRKGTPAATFSDPVPAPVVKERCRRVRQLGAVKRRAFMERFLNRPMEVLVEETRDPRSGMLKGVTANYIKVLLNGDDEMQNTFQNVRIERILDDRTVWGRVCP